MLFEFCHGALKDFQKKLLMMYNTELVVRKAENGC